MKLFNELCNDIKNTDNTHNKNLLKLVKGEIENELKRKPNVIPNDDLVIGIVKKIIKNNDIFIKTISCSAKIDELQCENLLLQKYVPTQLTSDQVIAIIATNKLENLAECMKFFRNNFANKYDSGLVKTLFVEYSSL